MTGESNNLIVKMANEDLNPVDNGETTEETLENSADTTELNLEAYNEATGKNYKSWDDVYKSEKERDKFFAEKGQKKGEQSETSKPPVVQTEHDIAEEVLELKHPEYVHVQDQLTEIAEKEGITKLQAFRKYSYLQKEAKSLAEATEQKGEAVNNINSPSGAIVKKKEISDLTPSDLKYLARSGNKQKVLEYAKYMERTGGR